MPLTPAGPAEVGPVAEHIERARKIQPRMARGETVRVAVALNLAEAELMQNILLEEGIPSILRRSGGFDVPDFLAAGPRDILVPVSGAEAARELLNPDGVAPPEPEPADPHRAAFRLAAAMLACLLLFGALAGLIWALMPS
jgi:hypothetical protein